MVVEHDGARLDDLERRVERLEQTPQRDTPAETLGNRWWLLDQLAERSGPGWERDGLSGAVAFGGRVHAPGSGDVVWQVECPAHAALDGDLDLAAALLAALGHPIRLLILRALIRGAATLRELTQLPGVGTTGQLAHHLRELRGVGLLTSARRNHYSIATERVVPVLVALAAALGPGALKSDEKENTE